MLTALLVVLALVGASIGQQFQTFVTLPNSSAVTIQVIESHPDQLAPGYIFLAPYAGEFAPNFGPQIFNTDGILVWYGNASAHQRGFDPKVCNIGTQNSDHLCFNDAAPVEQGGHGSGVIRVLDHTYKEILKPFGAVGNLRGPDFHELNNDGPSKETFIQDVFQVVPKNLSSWNGPENGYILSGCFQEIDWKSRALKFQWCSHDHVALEETFVYMNLTANQKNATSVIAGNGTTKNPWDYFHINSIDKTSDGGYLVSGRHTNTIYHVAGHNSPHGHKSGDIIWRLNGKRPTINTKGFTFCKQHHVRFHSMTSSTVILSIFDNAGDGVVTCRNMSSGMVISVNTHAKTASLVKQYEPPAGPKFLSESQGSVQFLGDVNHGNVVVGWGQLPYYSEYTNDGKLLYHAEFANHTGGDSSYRVMKYVWHGRPNWEPTILPYAQTCKGKMFAWASWNGATEVASWQFYKCATTTGSCKKGLKMKKQTFETVVGLGEIEEYAYAQALDSSGKILGKSKRAKVFVPKASLNCTESKCPDSINHFDTANSITSSCFNSSSEPKPGSGSNGNHASHNGSYSLTGAAQGAVSAANHHRPTPTGHKIATATHDVESAQTQHVHPPHRPNTGSDSKDGPRHGNARLNGHNGTSSSDHGVTAHAPAADIIATGGANHHSQSRHEATAGASHSGGDAPKPPIAAPTQLRSMSSRLDEALTPRVSA